MAHHQYNPQVSRNFVGSTNRPKLNALYIGKVKRTSDPTRMGRVQVWIKNLGGTENDPEVWAWCTYLSPFYGVTPEENITPGTNDWSKTQKSYGMWTPPPDIDTKVAVMFDEGDFDKGYIIGYPAHPYMNNMIPGNPSSPLKKIDEDATSYDSEIVKERVPATPVTEYNKKNEVNRVIDNTGKPVHPFVDELITQGLANDNVRGNTTSSARRESPSQVFGVSTPGPVDFFGQFTDKHRGNIHGSIMDEDGVVKKRANSRRGGHTFVMDDGTPLEHRGGAVRGEQSNELIRLRTRTGHQVLLHDTEGLIYIGTANGQAWMEFTKSGKIDIFANDSVSVHTKADFNFHANRDVNIEAGRNINMKAEGSWAKDKNAYHDEKLDNVSTGAIRLESIAETHIKVGGAGRIEVNQDFKMESLHGHVDLRATQVAQKIDDVMHPRKDVRIHATGDIDVLAGNSENFGTSDGDDLTSNINLQTVNEKDNNTIVEGEQTLGDDVEPATGHFNLKTSGRVNVDSSLDTSLKSSAKLQVSNTGTDIDGGEINLNSGTVSVTTAGSSATADQATISPLLTHVLRDTDTQYVFPYTKNVKSPMGSGDSLSMESIMKRVPAHEEWHQHEERFMVSVTIDRTDREYKEPNLNIKEVEANDLSLRKRSGLGVEPDGWESQIRAPISNPKAE